MVWFVVIGEGRPVRAVLEVIIAAPNATAEALVIADAERNPLAECAGRQALAMVDTRDLLGECRRLAGRSEGWLVSANSTIIIPREVLDLFEGRSLNLHPGLLPEYAGLHTHQWPIGNGEREFGVTVHRVEPQIDAGAIVGQVRFPISPEDTGLSLFSRCLTAGRELFS